MAKNILKEAIADAKAVREVALANAKAALEEAFTPRLQSMLSAKLSEELDEEDDKEEIEETYMEDKEETNENYMEEETNLDEEIDLEEILNELELEEDEDSKEETVDEAAKEEDPGKQVNRPEKPEIDEAKGDEEEEKIDEEMNPIYRVDDVQKASTKAEYVNEDKEFNLDALLEEINNLDEQTELHKKNEGETNEILATAVAGIMIGSLPLVFVKGALDGMSPEEAEAWKGRHPNLAKLMDTLGIVAGDIGKGRFEETYMEDDPRADREMEEIYMQEEKKEASPEDMAKAEAELAKTMGESTINSELEETKAALETIRAELNEVNLLNSKLLYVNRIFKANNLDEGQKLRVVETLDNAETIKEAKLIYETIKGTFTISKDKKRNPKISIREGLGMASKTSGTTQSNARKEVITETNDMVARFKKLANITIKQ